MSYKLLADELSRMGKVFNQYKEAQEIVDGLASAEQSLSEIKEQKVELLKDIEYLKKEKTFSKEAIDQMQEAAAEEAAKALAYLEERKAATVSQINSMVEEAKVKATDMIEKAKAKVKALEEKEKMVEKQVEVTLQVLAEKEDQVAQIESVLAKFK